MKKIFLIFMTTVFLIGVIQLAFADQTLIGYLNGQKMVMGVATTNRPGARSGTIMMTTGAGAISWDNLVESQHSYAEDWQTHPAGAPADWIAGLGSIDIYQVITGTNNYLQGTTTGTGRIGYTNGTTWTAPYDFQVTLTCDSVVPAATVVRMGVGAGVSSFLAAYQIYIYTPAANYSGITGAFMLRDGQNINLHIIPSDVLVQGNTFTLSLVTRDPVPVRFTDVDSFDIATATSPKVYITVEDFDANLSGAAIDTAFATITTAGGDSETVTLPEIWGNSGVFVGSIDIQRVAAVTPGNGVLEATANYTNIFVNYGANSDNAVLYAPAAAIVVSPVSKTLSIGGTQIFGATGGVPPFTWTSSDTAVASIDSSSGLLTALSVGNTTVTATDSILGTGTAEVTVIPTSALILPEPQSVIIQRMIPFGELYE